MDDLSGDVLDEIRREARRELELDAVEPWHRLRVEMALDSVSTVVLAVALEDRFRVHLREDDAGAVVTVQDLVELVCRRVAEARDGGARARLVGPPLPEVTSPTLNAALRRAAEGRAGVTLVDASEREVAVTFDELRASARRVAASLLGRGVGRGDRVAIVLPTGRDFLDAFFGALLAGAVPVPLYPPVRLGRMDEYVRSTARMLAAVGAVAALSDGRTRALLGRAIELARPRLGCPSVADLRDTRDAAEVEVAPGALGLIQFSSGSTGDPRPVALTHAQLVAQCASLRASLDGVDASSVGVSWLPLYHDMGLVGCLLSAVTVPGSLVLLAPETFVARPALWLRALSRHGGVVSPAPSFAYALCAKRARDDELAGVDLSRWRHALDGAEPVSPDVIARFCARFARYGFRREALRPVYGMSEAALALTFAPPGVARTLPVDAAALAATGRVTAGTRALSSVGAPVPGAEVEVRGDDGEVLPERAVGRVWARAPFVMRGYFGDPEATSRALCEGWLDTGDLGFVDGGELFLCGRAKDVVILRGANHSPQEFEEALDGVEGLRAGCAVALGFAPPDADGERLLVLAECAAPSSELTARVSAAVAERTGVVPHTVALLAPGTLPRTSSGKLRRSEALRRYLAGSLDAPSPVSALSVGVEVARSAAGYARSLLR